MVAATSAEAALASAALPTPTAATMPTDPAPPPSADPSPIVTLRISVRGLYDSWTHCQKLADYIARFAASDRFDPEQLTTRLSTYLNEVLEFVFRARPAEGELVVSVGRASEHLVVELAVPADAALAGELRRDFERVAGDDARARYGAEFRATLERAPADAGLLELVALHGVGLDLRERGGAGVIVLTVPHE